MNKLLLVFAICTSLVVACTDTDPAERFFTDDEITIAAYLDNHAGEYSLFIELLEQANFKSAFNAYGTYTLFIFNNSAFQTYLNSKGYTSVSQMPVEEAKVLVRYHSLNSVITSSSLGYGKLPVKNLEDDELVSAFDSTGLQGIIINREAKIISRDIELNNGVLHVIDKTLTPITTSVIQQLELDTDYSIFVEAVKTTGFYSILNDIYDTVSQDEVQRKYFTVFAEPNSVFNEKGFTSYVDLETAYQNGVASHTNPADSLYRFVANHIIPEKALFTKDFETSNYQSYLGELINMEVDLEFRINPLVTETQTTFITFIDKKTDFQAKNGVYHAVDSVLDIFYPEPVNVIWQFNDQPVVRDLLRVNGQDGDYYTSLDLFPNMYGTISTMFIHYPWNDYGFMLTGNQKYPNQFGDCLVFGAPDWDVTITMPIKIVKGRYRFYVSAKGGSGRATIQLLVNGVPVGEPLDLNFGGVWAATEGYVGELNLTETTENVVRMVTVNSGQGQMDYLRFEPIK